MELTEFIKAQAVRVYCKVCAHPSKEKIDLALKNGARYKHISNWTRTDKDGAPYISDTTLRKHKDEKHGA